MAAKAIAIPMEEYLRTSYEYDAEWVDGEVVERPLPNLAHSAAEVMISYAFMTSRERTLLFVRTNLRVPVSPKQWRVPDLSIFADRSPTAPVPVPYCVIEILSPADAMSAIFGKFSEYAAAGIQHIFLVDPEDRLIQKREGRSLVEVDAIELPERGFRLTAQEIFA